ncbi:MAG: lysophospholipid acyltransferase family protein [Rhodospirillales bacterium]
MARGTVPEALVGGSQRPSRGGGGVLGAGRRVAWLPAAACLWLIWRLAALLPVDWASALGSAATRVIGPRLRRQKTIARNLAIAFPDQSAAEIEALTREVWGSFGRVLAEYPHLATIVGRQRSERLTILVKGDIGAIRDGSKPAVFVEPHLANWELAAAIPKLLGFPLTVVFNPETNQWVTAMLQRRRRPLGCDFVANVEGLRPLVRELAHGRSVGFLIDRRVDSGSMVPFFGTETSMTLGPARLALKFGCPLIPVRVERSRGARFTVTLHEPVSPDGGGDDIETAMRMTRTVGALFESWIRERPQQWFCPKRLWPKKAKSAG